MIDGTYKIEFDVPFGKKSGTLALRTEGDTVFADIDAPIVGKNSLQGKVEGDTFTAEGAGKIKLVGKINYTLQGEVVQDTLHIDIHSNKGDFTLEGTRV